MTTPDVLPEARTTANTRSDHLADHAALHAFFNASGGQGLAGNDGGTYNAATAYKRGNIVAKNGKIYQALRGSTGTDPGVPVTDSDVGGNGTFADATVSSGGGPSHVQSFTVGVATRVTGVTIGARIGPLAAGSIVAILANSGTILTQSTAPAINGSTTAEVPLPEITLQPGITYRLRVDSGNVAVDNQAPIKNPTGVVDSIGQITVTQPNAIPANPTGEPSFTLFFRLIGVAGPAWKELTFGTGGGVQKSLANLDRGTWVSTIAYEADEIINFNGKTYQALLPSTGSNPESPTGGGSSVLAGYTKEVLTTGTGRSFRQSFVPLSSITVGKIGLSVTGTNGGAIRVGLTSVQPTSSADAGIAWLDYGDIPAAQVNGGGAIEATFASPVSLTAGQTYYVVVQGRSPEGAQPVQVLSSENGTANGLTVGEFDFGASQDAAWTSYGPYRLNFTLRSPDVFTWRLLSFGGGGGLKSRGAWLAATSNYVTDDLVTRSGVLYRATTAVPVDKDPVLSPTFLVNVAVSGRNNITATVREGSSMSLAQQFTTGAAGGIVSGVVLSIFAVDTANKVRVGIATALGPTDAAPVWLGATPAITSVRTTTGLQTFDLPAPVTLAPSTTYFVMVAGHSDGVSRGARDTGIAGATTPVPTGIVASVRDRFSYAGNFTTATGNAWVDGGQNATFQFALNDGGTPTLFWESLGGSAAGAAGSADAAKSTIAPGLPTLSGRKPGDLHYDETAQKLYVYTGLPGATYTDDFNRTVASGTTGFGGPTGSAGAPALTWSRSGRNFAINGTRLDIVDSGNPGMFFLTTPSPGPLVVRATLGPATNNGMSLFARSADNVFGGNGGIHFARKNTDSWAITYQGGSSLPVVSGSNTGTVTAGDRSFEMEFTATQSIFRIDGVEVARSNIVTTGIYTGFQTFNSMTASVDSFFMELPGTAAWTVSGVNATVGSGLPTVTGRKVGDRHYDTANGRDYLLVGAAWTDSVPVYLQSILAGELAVGTDVLPPGLRVPKATTARQIIGRVGTAPVGADVVFNVERFNNGTSAGVVGTVTIPAGSTTASVTGLSVVLAGGDILKVNVTSVGTTTKGSDLNISVDAW